MPSSFSIDSRIVHGHRLTRYNLGFGSANGAFIFFFPILTSALYLINDKRNLLITYPLLMGVILLIYYFTKSRTGFITSILLFVIMPLQANVRFFNLKVLKLILRNIVLVFIIISVLIAVFLSMSIYNELLAYRPGYWLIHLLQGVYHYNLFGYPWNEYYQGMVTKIPLDNSYISLVLAKGLIFTFIIYLFYYKGMALLLKFRETKSIIIILSIFVFGLFENTFFVVGFNISLFIIYHIIHLEYIKGNENDSKKDSLLLA